MSYMFPPDIRELVEQQKTYGNYTSEDEVLREALTSLVERNDDLAAIHEAIDAMENGDEGAPYGEVFDRIRTKYDIAADA